MKVVLFKCPCSRCSPVLGVGPDLFNNEGPYMTERENNGEPYVVVAELPAREADQFVREMNRRVHA